MEVAIGERRFHKTDEFEVDPKGRGSAACIACRVFNIKPAGEGARSLTSTDEADRLCRVHRPRMTEGLCVLCGRRAPWMSPFPKSDIGCCQLCYMALYGVEAAEELELSWREQAG